MRLVLWFFAILMLGTATGWAQPVTVVRARAIDGDTLRIGDQVIRIVGLDTPEIFTVEQCKTIADTKRVLWSGYAAQGRLQQLLNTREITINREGFDKYGRIVATVFAGKDNVADILINEGLARIYVCKNFRCPRREPWCPTN